MKTNDRARIKKYLSILCCPNCTSDLHFKANKFLCKKCKTSYPYKKGIPVFVSSKTSTEHMDKQAQIYDREYAQAKYAYVLENWQLSYIKRTAEIFGITTKQAARERIYLDIGAGPGHTVIELAKLGVLTVGCDISYAGAVQAMRLAKRQKVYDRCLYVVCDAAQLPFKKNTIDYVTCIMLLEHLENDGEVVSEMARVLRKKGKVYIAVPNTYWHFWVFMWPINYWHDRRLGHLRHYSKNSIISLAREHGLNNPRVFYSAHLIKFVQLFYKKLPATVQDRAWWKMEQIDESQHNARTGLHLNAVFTK